MTMTENERLSVAVDSFAAAMKARLYQKAREGYTGWDGAHDPDDLRDELVEDAFALERGGTDTLSVDIACRCMMLYRRMAALDHEQAAAEPIGDSLPDMRL